MLRAVEGHMLGEVGESALIVFLDSRAGGLHKVEINLVGRTQAAFDVICETALGSFSTISAAAATGMAATNRHNRYLISFVIIIQASLRKPWQVRG